MSYWLEERTELALGTIRCSHPPLHPQMMEQPGSCLLPELQVFVCRVMFRTITLSAATNEDGCVKCVTPSWSWSSAHFAWILMAWLKIALKLIFQFTLMVADVVQPSDHTKSERNNKGA